MRESEADRQNLKRRSFLASAILLPFGLAGCGFLEPTAAVQPVPADADSYPVKITSSYGDISVPFEPKRIVALDSASADSLLALDIVPVGMSNSGIQSNGASPWFDFTLNGRPGPDLLDSSKTLPLDQIKNLKPDLILAVNSSISRQDYGDLSKIALVLAPPGKPMNTDWKTTMTLVGQALGRAQKATQLIKEIADSVDQAIGNYPALKGTTVTYFRASAAPGADLSVFGLSSNPLQVLTELGLELAPSVKNASKVGAVLDPSSGPQLYQWPRDKSAELSSDVAVISLAASEVAVMKDGDLLNTVPAYRLKRGVIVDSASNGFALENASVLSMRWIVRNLVSEIAKVAYLSKK
ncbi:ABC transporter substrate-binding protein [Psychromicrobium lacuslunae]|uniref:Fe/B12 periplasmic-binding domain-containing protein n=1 Tax=Psychromicrobium lacuslunae TaxID=1618207 RepID=A0A0D4BYK7_9MICC|nr:ABC transporter substrate-binding protein [Psychromicrobium lacuslunae]AJT41423.1 hypothetical protein UM93_07660 [Psychromicrobium lacuslunae]